ncbi:F-box protein CPR1-like protein [Tanacetum coccineum]
MHSRFFPGGLSSLTPPILPLLYLRVFIACSEFCACVCGLCLLFVVLLRLGLVSLRTFLLLVLLLEWFRLFACPYGDAFLLGPLGLFFFASLPCFWVLLSFFVSHWDKMSKYLIDMVNRIVASAHNFEICKRLEPPTYHHQLPFIAGYGARNTQPRSLLLRYKYSREDKYVCFVDDENNDDTLTQQQDLAPNVTDAMKRFNGLKVTGSSHGLLCLRCRDDKDMLVLWNPFIRKSVSIKLPYLPWGNNFLGFAVCPANNDPTIVMITYPWKVVIFTLSSKRFTEFQYTKMPPKSIRPISSQVVIDSCIYWAAFSMVDGSSYFNYMIMSFDLIAKEIRLVDIPHTCILNNPFPRRFFISKLMESIVLFVLDEMVDIPVCGVWKMEHDETFTKLFTINIPHYTISNILGFRKNGELVMETKKKGEWFAALELYQPCSERISDLGIYGKKYSFFMDS